MVKTTKSTGAATSESVLAVQSLTENGLFHQLHMTMIQMVPLRQKCTTQTRDTRCKVYNTALEEIAELEPANRDAVSTYMPTFNSFGSSLYRARQRMYPALPTTRQTIQLKGKWTETLNHERFLLADADQLSSFLQLTRHYTALQLLQYTWMVPSKPVLSCSTNSSVSTSSLKVSSFQLYMPCYQENPEMYTHVSSCFSSPSFKTFN